MTHETVGNAVRSARTELGLTQQELAEQTGLARQSIISIEKGRFTPTIENALRLSEVLDRPIDKLFWLK